MERNDTSSNTINTIKLFFPNYNIVEGDNFVIDKERKKIILLSNMFLLDDKELLGLILLFSEKKDINEDILDNNLSELEKEQLKKVFSYIKTYHETETNFMLDKKGKIKDFLNKLSKKITAKGPLWEFIKDELSFLETDYKSIDDFVEKYLNYKGVYLENQKRDQEDTDNNIEDESGYNEHDGVDMEQMEGKDMGVIGYLEPAINKSYFVRSIMERWNDKTGQLNQISTNKKKLEPELSPTILTTYFGQAKKGKQYILSLSKDLKPVSWDEKKIDIFKDSYGRYFFELKEDGDFEINIGYRKEKEQFFDNESVSKVIYTGNNIDLSNFNSWKDLKNFIQSKKYSNVSQRGFKSGNDWNKYIENLFNAKEMDCLPANILFTILARSLGYKTRLVVGFTTYKKDGKTYVSKNKGHAWSEIYLNGKWKRVDATPVSTDEDLNEEQDIENQIENIVEGEGMEEKEVDKLNLNHNKHELKEVFDSLNLPNIESRYFKSAINYVRKDAEQIISYIRKIQDKRKEMLNKQKMRGVPKKNRGGLLSGKIKLNPNTIEKLSVGDPNIFERKRKITPELDEDIDTLLKDIIIAIDVSGSMGLLSGDWENGTKLDNAYLSVVLLYLVSKGIGINFSKVITFSDEVGIFTPEEALNKLEYIAKGGNTQNANGIKKAIEEIKDTKKGVVFVISDGDGETGQEFFNEESRNMLKMNKNLFIVGYGIGEDAISKLQKFAKEGKIPTVIEYRMNEAGHKRSKGYPVKEYTKLVEELKDHLVRFITHKNIIL